MVRKAFLRKIFDTFNWLNFSDITFNQDKSEEELLSAFIEKGVSFSYGDLTNKKSVDLFLENSALLYLI